VHHPLLVQQRLEPTIGAQAGVLEERHQAHVPLGRGVLDRQRDPLAADPHDDVASALQRIRSLSQDMTFSDMQKMTTSQRQIGTSEDDHITKTT
jgi:hypothetical protein